MSKFRRLLFPIIAFFLISIILSGPYLLIQHQMASVKKEQYEFMAANQASMISGKVDTAMARVYTMEALIKDNDGKLDFFDKQIPKIFEETVDSTGVGLRNVAAAPEGVVEKVYPIKGNESLIKFDFMDVEKPGNKEAVAAYQRGELVVTNPFKMVQGCTGMAGRLPVFLKEGDKKTFWGLVTVTMEFQGILDSFQLDTFENSGVNYELWYTDADGKRITLSKSQKKPDNPVNCQVRLSNLNWNLSVAPDTGWYNDQAVVLGLVMILAVAFLVAALLAGKNQIRQANKRLEELAHRDQLTKCYSRHYVQAMLVNQHSGRWNDSNARYSIAIADIDSFKKINDKYGHETGDEVLTAVARVLQKHTKEDNGDCIVRHGGDEFLLLYNDVSEALFEKKLTDILKEIQEIRLPDHPDLRVSVSIGGEKYKQQEGSFYYDMVRKADQKLYAAKKSGKNQFIIE